MAEEEGEEQKPQKTREAGEAAAAMDKVTDFAEEKEMRANVDKSKVQQAMATLAAEQAARKEAQRQRERELAAVKVSRVVSVRLLAKLLVCCRPPYDEGGALTLLAQVQKADVELVAGQFDLDMKRAERCLREAKGDVKATLQSLLNV